MTAHIKCLLKGLTIAVVGPRILLVFRDVFVSQHPPTWRTEAFIGHAARQAISSSGSRDGSDSQKEMVAARVMVRGGWTSLRFLEVSTAEGRSQSASASELSNPCLRRTLDLNGEYCMIYTCATDWM